MDARASGSDKRKAPSVTADKAGRGGLHGVRQGQQDKNGGRQECERTEPSRMGGNYGGREASGLDPKTHRVRGKEEGREASGVAENPGGGRHGVGRGVELPHDDSTHRESRRAQGRRNPGIPHSVPILTGGGVERGGGGGDENPPTDRATRGQEPDGRDGAE